MLLFSIIYPHIDGHASKEANCIFIRKKVILASLEIMDRIYSKLKNNVIPFTVYLVFSKAYDCLTHATLLDKLHYYGICVVAK